MTSVQKCMVCGESFGGTRAGDMHRVLDRSYVLARVGGRVSRYDSVEGVPGGGEVLSLGNAAYRCLSAEEMVAKGLRLNHRGRWVRQAPDRMPQSTPRPGRGQDSRAAEGRVVPLSLAIEQVPQIAHLDAAAA